ncbi:hypothetical protein OC861_005945 [Tilletia horrida]|nr:hypothetical protein OC845_006526 [Tilletia horrida]KAK0561192.1 hypothetical protein OC861_005945 [Tilletia horrida]
MTRLLRSTNPRMGAARDRRSILPAQYDRGADEFADLPIPASLVRVHPSPSLDPPTAEHIVTPEGAEADSGPAPSDVDENGAGNFLDALRDRDLNGYADMIQNNTDFILADGSEKVVLAFTEQAIAALPSWVTSNPAYLQYALLQHVLIGAFPQLPLNLSSSQTSRIHTIGYSMLNSGAFANLPGGNGQVVVFSSSRGPRKSTNPDDEDGIDENGNQGFVNEALNDSQLRGDSFRVGTVTVVPINRSITVPGSLQYTLDSVVGTGMKQASLLFNPKVLTSGKYNGSSGLPGKGDEAATIAGNLLPSSFATELAAKLETYSAIPGVTMFVPAPLAVTNFLTSDQGKALLGTDEDDDGKSKASTAVSDLLAIVGQHVVEARTLYSPLMRDLCFAKQPPPVTTASGLRLQFECGGRINGTTTLENRTERRDDNGDTSDVPVFNSPSNYSASYPIRVHLSDKSSNLIVSASLVQTDIIFANGVMHLIDNLLVSTSTDQAAAVSARSNALRKANSDIAGPLSASNCGDGGINAGDSSAASGVTRPPSVTGNINSTTSLPGSGGRNSSHTVPNGSLGPARGSRTVMASLCAVLVGTTLAAVL